VYAIGYVASAKTVNVTCLATAPSITVTSINCWIVLFSRDTPAFDGDMTWNDLKLEVAWNCLYVSKYTSRGILAKIS